MVPKKYKIGEVSLPCACLLLFIFFFSFYFSVSVWFGFSCPGSVWLSASPLCRFSRFLHSFLLVEFPLQVNSTLHSFPTVLGYSLPRFSLIFFSLCSSFLHFFFFTAMLFHGKILPSVVATLLMNPSKGTFISVSAFIPGISFPFWNFHHSCFPGPFVLTCHPCWTCRSS